MGAAGPALTELRGVRVRGRADRLPLRVRAASLLCLAAAVAGPALLNAPSAAASSGRPASSGFPARVRRPAPSGRAGHGPADHGGAGLGTAADRGAVARSLRLDRALFGTGSSGALLFGPQAPVALRAGSGAVLVAHAAIRRDARTVAPLRRLLPADLLVVAPSALPAGTAARIRRLPGVLAAQLLDAARIEVNGKFAAILGVDPSAFRAFAARPTARSTGLWQAVADGGIAVSYTMGRQDRLPLGGSVTVAGARTEKLRVGGFGTVGIAGVDGVVSDPVARSLGIPAGNAVVISAPHADLSSLMTRVQTLLPRSAAVAPLVTQAISTGLPVTSGAAGAPGVTTADGPGLSPAEVARFLAAARSRVGHAVCVGSGRAARVRLLRPGAVVAGAGRRGHAAGGRGPGAHRPADPGEPAAARRPALLPHRPDRADVHLARGDLPGRRA